MQCCDEFVAELLPQVSLALTITLLQTCQLSVFLTLVACSAPDMPRCQCSLHNIELHHFYGPKRLMCTMGHTTCTMSHSSQKADTGKEYTEHPKWLPQMRLTQKHHSQSTKTRTAMQKLQMLTTLNSRLQTQHAFDGSETTHCDGRHTATADTLTC